MCWGLNHNRVIRERNCYYVKNIPYKVKNYPVENLLSSIKYTYICRYAFKYLSGNISFHNLGSKKPNTTVFVQEQPSRGVLRKGVLKIFSKFTGEHPCQSVISIKLQSNFIEIALLHGCSPVNLQHFFRAPFYKNTYGRLLLFVVVYCICSYCKKICPHATNTSLVIWLETFPFMWNLRHSFPMHLFYKPRGFQGAGKGCIRNEWVKTTSGLKNPNYKVFVLSL